MIVWNVIGYLAAGLVLLAFAMKDIIRLRIVAVCSNFAFIAYGLAAMGISWQLRLGAVFISGLAFLATRFAAKEAISKAVGLGMRLPMSWRAVEIVNQPGGRPCAIANGAFAAFLEGRRLRLHVSVADIANLAVAYAVAETVDG